METFTGFIHDDRYAAPTLMLFLADGERQARAIVHTDLDANPHHLSVEVFDSRDRLLFVEDAGRRASEPLTIVLKVE